MHIINILNVELMRLIYIYEVSQRKSTGKQDLMITYFCMENQSDVKIAIKYPN